MRHSPLVLALVTACSTPTESTADGGADSTPTPDAAAAPSIAEVLDCGTNGNAGTLPQGTELRRIVLDAAQFPEARCNDGTQAVFYVRPAATAAGRGRWMIQLQGGGGCHTADDCARRWCSVDSNLTAEHIGMEHMTSRNAPAAIDERGILSRDSRNPYADANHAFLRYCSSDNHAGRTAAMDVDAHHPKTNEPVRFRIEFHGRDILDGMLSTLRQHGVTIAGMPDLDDATDVVFAGASAGGGGVTSTVDYVGELLRSHNTNPAGLAFVALIDSTFGPSNQTLDWSTSKMCTVQGLCTYPEIMLHYSELYAREPDASCAAYHASRPGTEWMCQDLDHVLRNHVTTPHFIRQGLRDRLIGGNSVNSMVTVPGRGPMTAAMFEELVRADLAAVPDLASTAEEGAAITTAPGAFGPPCAKHETLSDNPNALAVSVTANGSAHTMFSLFTAWQAGQGQPVVWNDGMDANCP